MATDPLSFTSATYPVGAGPFAVAVGDLNSDGKPDLVVTNQHSNSLSILLNNGDGSFQVSQTIPVGATPEGVAVGDFNGDGKPDIVVTNYNSDTISVLLNNGTGSFQLSQTVIVNGGPAAVAVGDFNGDSKLDLVTANYNNSTISILLNNGTGSFQVSQTIPVGVTPVSVAVGDFNNDGKPDLAVANFNANSLSILLNNGTGSFQVSQTIPFGANPSSVAVGDFNGDGILDLAVTNRANNSLSILLNNGTGSFQLSQTIAVGAGPNAVAVGDFNSDGIPDLVTANVTANTVSILLNNGTGSFQSAQNFSVGTSPNAVAIGDFNGDGELDLVTANNGNNNVSVLLQTQLRVQVNNISATANVPFSGTIATITGANMATVIIDWGDGSPMTTETVSGSGNTLTVSGTHTYTTPGSFTLTVNATDGTRNAHGTGQATVVQAPLVVQVNNISATANVPFNGTVATITGANMATATIDWGDGSSTTIGTVSGSGNTLTVSGTHTYTTPGSFTLTVNATDGTRNAHGTEQATVQPLLAVEVATIQAVATIPFSGVVAIISGATSSNDTATINWGDGSLSTPGTVVTNPDGTLTVSGTHTYSQRGTFPLTVRATEGARSAQNTGQAIVKTASLHARAFGLQSTNPDNGPFGDASITDSGGNQTVTVPSVVIPDLSITASTIVDTVSGSLTPPPPSVGASSTIGSLTGPGIVALGVQVTAHTDLSVPGGVTSGTTSFATLVINGTVYPTNFTPAPGTVVPLPGVGTVTLNEQPQASQNSIVVNGMHISITQGPNAGADILVGHVETAINLV